MGCGSSRSTRLVSPLSKAVITPHLSWTHGKVMPMGLRPKPKFPLVEKCVQVGQKVPSRNESSQTEAKLPDEEELEWLMYDVVCEPENTDVETQTGNSTQATSNDNVKSVLMQTEETAAFQKRKFAYFSSAKIHCVNVVTIDIGVQAIPLTMERWTQTNRLGRSMISYSRGMSVAKTVAGKMAAAKRPPSLAVADFESQTDPVTRALAANAAGNENMLNGDSESPIAHIQKELHNPSATKSGKVNNSAIHESIARLLEDVEDSLRCDSAYDTRMGYADILRCDAEVQTVNDPITDEAPEYAARPPPCKKKEMIPNMAVFKEVDRQALEAPESARSSVRNLVNYLTAVAKTDLQKVRAFFRWIANNITYDWRYMEVRMSAEEVIQRGEGVCKDYCKLFSEMCRISRIRVKTVNGFAKGYDYRPGHQFLPGEDVTHAWNAVFIFGAWRLIDTTWGTGYVDHTGKFQRKLNEHFFLTDPEVMIWTHFPYDDMEKNYSRMIRDLWTSEDTYEYNRTQVYAEFKRTAKQYHQVWQLLDTPYTLEEFNSLPKVTPYFFEYNMRIRTKPTNPIVFKVHKELKISSHEPLRFKYKMYSVEEVENSALNNYVFCQLKEDRLVGSFAITPPVEGKYYFKVYAKPEKEMKEDSSLHNIAIFLIECLQAKKYLQPYPMNEVPWGPTQSFYDYNMRLVNQSGPMIVSWGGKRKLIIQIMDNMLITLQVFDVDGNEVDVKGLVSREEKGNKLTLTVFPTRVTMYKLLLFGMPKPKQKGKWRLPLVASFLIDCKLTRHVYDEEFPPPQPRKEDKDDDKKNDKNDKKKKR